MQILATLAVVLQVLSALGIIVLVLLQQGKGADMGAAFGSGSSGSLFGATGSANFLSRMTAVLATVFFVCTLAIAFFAGHRPTAESGSVMDRTPAGTGAATSVPPVPGQPAGSGAAGPGSVPPASGAPAGSASPSAAPSEPVKPAVDPAQKSGPASEIPK